MIKQVIRRIMQVAGYVPVKISNSLPARRITMMQKYGIDTLLDVGANQGQYASQVRELGYDGQIVSFEPLTEAYQLLEKRTRRNNSWKAVNCALGDFDGESEINISGNLYSSSILNMLTQHRDAAPESVYVGKEDISVRRLDSIFSEYCKFDDNIFLKIDTQGYEMRVIDGAESILDQIIGIQMEVSLVPLYESEVLLVPMIKMMQEKGFELMGLEPGFSNPESGQLLQVDCIFFRSR